VSISRKVAYNVVASSISKILSTLAALIGIGLITRYLGQDGFGIYATALTFLSFFGALGDWGVYQTATREISRPKSKEGEIMSNAIGIRLTISLLIVLITPIVVLILPYPTELKIAIFIIALSYIFSSFYQILNGLFQKRLMMDRVTFAELIGKIIQVILIYVGIKLDLGFYFIVGTLLVNMIINFSIVAFLARKFIRLRPKVDKIYWKNFLKQSLPVGLSVAVTFLYFKAGIILLSLLRPASDVGIYSAAHKVIENITFFPSMIVGLTMPMFAYNIFHKREKFEFLANKNLKVFFILTIPLVIGGWFLAEDIISIIIGPDFGPSAKVLKIIIFALAFIFFGNLFSNILVVAKLQKYLLAILSICAIFNLTLNLIFIPRFSYLATAYISTITELMVAVLTCLVIVFKLKYLPHFSKATSIILSGFLMAIYLWHFDGRNFFFLFFSSSLIYLAGLIILKAISKKELLSLIKKEI
jgi:O-antigen/teichoic acid export membrane protein